MGIHGKIQQLTSVQEVLLYFHDSCHGRDRQRTGKDRTSDNRAALYLSNLDSLGSYRFIWTTELVEQQPVHL
jgi:hypothetical protein